MSDATDATQTEHLDPNPMNETETMSDITAPEADDVAEDMEAAADVEATEPAAAAPDLEHQILVALDASDGESATRVPAVAAATLGGLAAAAGVIALAARRRSAPRLAG